jgi:glycosyltransferase involved in cell wall biosynthesis
MKVVYLADAPYIHTRRWIEHSVARGHDCEVISFRPAEIEGARVHYVGGAELLGKARYLINARRVSRLVHELQPDLVHAMHLTSYGFLAALAGFRPLIISVWGTDVLEAPNLTPMHDWLTRYSLARADSITATGLNLATETSRYSPRGRPINVVPYGADIESFKPARRYAVKRAVIGTAARMSSEKGIEYLIEAFALLRARFGDRVSLRIAGEGPEQDRLQALTRRLGLENSVEFRGWIDHEALPAFLQELDVFALPSLYEGFGVAAVEASAMALPVVASNINGIPDVVRQGKTGLLTPPRDAHALAEAIAVLVEDAPLRRRLGAAGRALVAQQYDWQKNAAQMDRIYELVLDRHGHKAIA